MVQLVQGKEKALEGDAPEAMLEKFTELGLEAVEIAAAEYPGTPHCPVKDLLGDPAKARALYAVQGRIADSLFTSRTTAAAWKPASR